MNLSNIKGRTKVIYECMWGGDKPVGIELTASSDSSGATYKISGDPGDNGETIQKAFEISNPEMYAKQYNKAISGNGDEAKKILSLHSSSRCALLCFYNVEAKPIKLNIKGEDIEFNYSTFEFKNPVIRYPSNMDVVLLSTDRKTVLFLESKFSEYYISAGDHSAFISKSYLDKNKPSGSVYSRIDEIDLSRVSCVQDYKDGDGKVKKRDGFKLVTKDGSINYLDGIKQMISHYVGVIRRLEGKSLKADLESEINAEIYKEVVSALNAADSKVYLGEILFDRFFLPKDSQEEDPAKLLKAYSGLYEKLAEILNNEISKRKYAGKFEVLPEDILYSEVMQKNATAIEKKTLKFYGIEA